MTFSSPLPPLSGGDIQNIHNILLHSILKFQRSSSQIDTPGPGITQRKILVLVNGNKFKKDRQQHKSTSNFVSANSLIAKFLRYGASAIASLGVNASDLLPVRYKEYAEYIGHFLLEFFY